MPAPDHLRLILHVIGTGGTREMAERVHEYTAGLQRQIDGLTAQITQLTQAATAPPDVAALRGEVKAALAEARRMTRLREETLIGVEQALAGAGVVLTADDDPVDVVARVLREQAAEVARFRGEHDRACGLVAKMHAAAVGEVRGPIRGVVEDVQDLRTALDTMERRWADALREINQLAGTDHLTDFYARATGGQAPDIHLLIERSSLGTPDAVAARESVPVELAQAVVARAAELAGDDDLTAVTVGDMMLAREAAASVALDRDPRAETIVIDDGQGDSEDDWDDEPAPDAEPLYMIGQVEPVAYVPTAAPADGTPAATRPAPSNDEIRAWCRARGIVVSDRGPIGKTARAKYDDAHREA